jgi:hypothetical protein
MLKIGNYYYWYGTSYINNPHGTFGVGNQTWEGFRVYRSLDLKNWECLGLAMARPDRGWCSHYTSHRPHVLYCRKAGMFVMWFFNFLTYPGTLLMVAVSDSPQGPFRLLGPRQTCGPSGFGQDLNVFADHDEHAYLVYDDGTRHIRIDRLTDDYLACEGETCVAIAGTSEAPAMIKLNDHYMVAASGVDGWNGTDTIYVVADDPMGCYSQPRLLAPSKAWGAQLTDICHVSENQKVLVMFDQWWNPDPTELDASRYLWLPLDYGEKDGEVCIRHCTKWNP